MFLFGVIYFPEVFSAAVKLHNIQKIQKKDFPRTYKLLPIMHCF